MKILQTFGKIKVVKASDSATFKERKTGFVAITENGSEYYAERQNQAIANLVSANGPDAI